MRFVAPFSLVRLKFFEGSRCVQEEHFVLACAPPWVAGSYWCLHVRTEKNSQVFADRIKDCRSSQSCLSTVLKNYVAYRGAVIRLGSRVG